MTQSRPPKANLLDDLESIRALLGNQEPPELSETIDPNSIPLLSDVVAQSPAVSAAQAEIEPREPAVRTAFRTLAERHLDLELRTAAQLILQDVIDDFVPQIEAELRNRLEARAEQLIKSHRS